MSKMLYRKKGLQLVLLFLLCSISGMTFADVEPNDDLATANPLELGAEVSGDLFVNPANDANDYYAVVLPANGEVTITAAYESGLNGFVYLYRSTGALITNVSVSGTTATLTADCVGSGLIYVRASRSSGSGNYTLEVNLNSASFNEDVEPNGSLALINETFSVNQTFTGQLGYSGENSGNAVDTEDWYYVIPDDDGQVTLDVEYTNTLTGFIYLHYKQGTQISNAAASPGNNQLIIDCLAQDTVAVRITRSSGCGSYSASVSVSSPAIGGDVEPNNVFAEAQEIFNTNEIVDGRLGYFDIDTGTDNEDWYKIVLDNDGEVSMTFLSSNTLNGFIYFYSKAGVQFTNASYAAGVETTLTYDCLAQDTIYIRLTRSSGCGDYTASVSVDSPLLGNDAEPNNVFAEAFEVFQTNEAIEGHLGYFDADTGTDTEDWYAVVLDDDGLLTLTFESFNTLNGFVYFYSKAGIQFTSTSYAAGTQTVLNYDCVAQDTVYLRFLRSSGCGDYMAGVSVTPPPLAGDVEPNGAFGSEQEIFQTNEEFTGRLRYFDVDTGTDAEDWYEVVLSNDGTASVNILSDGSLNGFIYLYSKAGVQYSSTSFQAGEPSTLNISCLAADTAHIRILGTAGCGSYQASLNMTPDIYENDPEPNGSLATAVPGSGGQINEGHLGYFDVDTGTDTDDWYSFQVGEAPFEAEAELQVVGGLNGFLYFYTSSGSLLINTSFSEGQTTLPYTFTEEGTYYLRLFRSSGCGQYQLNKLCGTTPEVTIAEGSQTVCPGEEVTFTANAGLDIYEWVVDATIVSNEQTYTTSETGSLFVRGIDANGCIGVSDVVSLNNFSVPTLNIVADGDTDICEGNSVTLSANDAFDSYLWSNGETGSSIVVDEAGIYSVTGTTADGCEAVSNGIEVTVSSEGECAPDCAGVPGGESVFDECGVCRLPDDPDFNSTCTDCAGVVNGEAFLDNCGECVGGTTGLEPCEDDCFGVPGGEGIVDDCGVCRLPDDPDFNSTCLDCAGVPNGDSILDECGVCRLPDDPDFNSTCLDCEGVPNGPAQPGTVCDANGEPGTYDEECNCVPDEVPCDNFRYFMASANEDGGSDIYELELVSNGTEPEAVLSLLASVDVAVSIAYDGDSDLLYMVHRDAAAYQTLDVSLPGSAPSAVLSAPYNVAGFTGAAYGDGLLYASSEMMNRIYSYDPGANFGQGFSPAPIGNGDIAFGENGDLYLASDNPTQAFIVMQGAGGISNIGFVPPGTSGLALMESGNFLLSVDGRPRLIVGDEFGDDTGVRYLMTLDGGFFIPSEADLASGCASINVAFMPEQEEEPTALHLKVSPNPSEGVSWATFSTDRGSNATLEVFDMTGRRVALLFAGNMDAETEYRAEFDGSSLPNGVYLYRFTNGTEVVMEKLIIGR